jgi:hypothetical protein
MYNIGSEIRNTGVAHAAWGRNNGSPYQLAHVTPYTTNFPLGPQVATYTSDGQISTLAEGNYITSFYYNADKQRVKMMLSYMGSIRKTKYYFAGSYEKVGYFGLS